MHLPEGFWASVTYVVGIFSLSPSNEPGTKDQTPLGPLAVGYHEPVDHQAALEKGPIFKPPSGRPSGDGSNFRCDYSKMRGWEPCSTAENRTCWLKHKYTKDIFDIYTNYEDHAPNGIERYYEIDAIDGISINADGVDFPAAKLFDGKYPGTWVQACWGDTVTVKINNWMKRNGGNGTSIHWHGVRQLNSVQMDGVNGVTQCPIAPGDSFTYSFKVQQYGTSWYHSHHSVQYADGLAAPLTFHGPTISPYDEAIDPLLMTDWGHQSAFEAIQEGTFGTLQNPSILLNGKGNATRYNNVSTPLKSTHDIPKPYTIHFDRRKPGESRPKRYLLRLINTSFASSFIFTIDHHWLQVVTADFVPIHAYRTRSVMVAIGQRYHVIVEADPQPYPPHPDPGPPVPPDDGNYWIRTFQAGCTDFSKPNGNDYNKVGILRYDDAPDSDPLTEEWYPEVPKNCVDEYYDHLRPVVNWTVGHASNDPAGIGQPLHVTFKPNQNTIYPLAKFSLGGKTADDFDPLYLDYGNPTFLNLNFTGPWDPLLVVLPENGTDKDWVYFVIHGGGHPIHLHGHDFAIVAKYEAPKPLPTGYVEPQPDPRHYNRTNPPRRDVVMLPQNGGWVVIAFKTDNPGAWLMHCHIAFHASWGLALQFLERQKDAADLWPSIEHSQAISDAQRVCNNWNKWWGDCRHWWPGDGKGCRGGNKGFAPDSGI